MRKVCILVILLVLFCVSWGQTVSTRGTRFWYTFPESRYCVPSEEQINLYILASRYSTVVIANPRSSWDTTVSVVTDSVTVVSIPREECFCEDSSSYAGLSIIASDTVALYASYACSSKMMMTPVWPTSMLGTHYIVQNYQPYSSQKYPSDFVIVAVEDSTEVNIWPNTHGVAMQVNNPIVLPFAGMCRTYKSYNCDISDIRLTSLTCQPFALFQSNAALNTANSDENFNYVSNEAIPVNYWSTQYIVVPFGMGTPDKVRVMSLKDRCEVWRNGQVDTVLDAAQWYEFSMVNDSVAQYLEASSPIGVTFFQGCAVENGVGNGNYQMFPLVSLHDGLHQVTAYCPSFPNVSQHYLNIIAQTAYLDSMLLDGNTLASFFTPVVQRPDYSVAHIPVTMGMHHLCNSQGEGFVATLSGSGVSSYGCLVGANMHPLSRAQMFFDSLDVMSSLNGNTLCLGDTAYFSMRCNGYDSIAQWYYGDGASDEGTSTQHCYTVAGSYSVMLVIIYRDGFCYSNDTLRTTIRIVPSLVNYLSDTITIEQLPWTFADRIYTEGVENDTLRYQSQFYCDSLIIYSLYIIDDTLRDECNDTLFFPNVVTANGDGVNDRFVIVGLLENNCYLENTLYIYNRWGREMYHVRNICRQEDFWDPNVHQRPTGTYFYVFTARSATKKIEHHGVIEVLR